MKLALFTPGAYIWPVHRSLEAFLASLGAPARDELSVVGSPVYPATFEAEPPLSGLAPQLDARLLQLHRDLYDAMLRPIGFFSAEELCMADYFWPDLRETSIGQLLEAFLFYFTRQVGAGVALTTGLSVIRAVFFNHEQAEPEHWIYTSTRRLAHLRNTAAEHSVKFNAPIRTRVQDLAFVIHTALGRPPLGAGWITGAIRRGPDGLCRAEMHYGLDPALDSEQQPASAIPAIEDEIKSVVRYVFGWDATDSEVAA
jgi:hypothetical protein